MPDFKIRRNLYVGRNLTVGNSLTVTGATTQTGNINFSGTASFSGPIAAGSAGPTFNDLILGSASINQPSAAASSIVVGASIAVTGAASGDYVFVTATGSLTPGMMLMGASCVAGGISASWLNATYGDIAASANVRICYLIFS